jgi:hypothetical protein
LSLAKLSFAFTFFERILQKAIGSFSTEQKHNF